MNNIYMANEHLDDFCGNFRRLFQHYAVTYPATIIDPTLDVIDKSLTKVCDNVVALLRPFILDHLRFLLAVSHDDNYEKPAIVAWIWRPKTRCNLATPVDHQMLMITDVLNKALARLS